MRVLLEIADGPQAGVQIPVATGEPLSVGRTGKSRLVLAHDSYLSGLHFSVEVDGARCLLRDANSSNGTFVNEQRISEVELRDGDRILAGQTRFAIRLEKAAETPTRITALYQRADETMIASAAAGPLEPSRQELVEYLRHVDAPLYALVDATSAPALNLLLAHSTAPCARLDESGPSLVIPQADSRLLPELARSAWGSGRVAFLTSRHPFEMVRGHLRAYYLARTGDGRGFIFRFHDPRMLQLYLSGCPPEEAAQFFGPVEMFLVEDTADPRTLLEYGISGTGLRKRTVRLGGEAGLSHSARVS
ncbi:MAG: FHA domain-containing protein [Bryobacteraceae bacterium]|nr:FHA domain-containing protein [Bryobacteraceae bacterium]